MTASDGIEDYVATLKRRAENTKASRRYALERLNRWADGDVAGLSEDNIEEYIVYLQAEGLKNSTINAYLSAIREYFKYLKKQLTPGVGEAELRELFLTQQRYDAIIEIEGLNTLEDDKEAISKEAIEDILQRAKDKSEQQYRIILLLAYFGLRKSELINLRCADVDTDKREIRIVDSKTAAGYRTIPYAPEIVPFLDCDREYVIESTQGGAYSESAFNHILRKYENDLTGRLYPHRLRSTLDTYLIEAGVDKYVISLLMGWKGSEDMVDYYRGRTEQLIDLKRAAMEREHYLIGILRRLTAPENGNGGS